MNTFKKELLSGVLYSAIAKYSGIIVSIVITAILARLLTPEYFGTIAIATVFISFFSTLTTVGISPAIVQNKTINQENIRSINSFTFLIATFFSIIYMLIIPLICRFYHNGNTLKIILYLLTVNIFFSVATVVPNSLFLKNKRFRFIAIRTFSIQVCMGFLSVIAAYMGLGIYSLLINPILGSLTLFVINYKYYPIGFSKIKKESINKILSFSLYQLMFNFTYILYRNIDKIIVGRIFGMNVLGYYEKSYRLMMLPLENISGVISPVLHPLLSEYQNDKEYIWKSYLRLISILSEIGLLLTVIIYFSSDCIILLLYGKQWEASIPIFQVLSLSIGFQIIQSPIGAIFQSINRVKGLFYSSLWLLFFILLSVFLSIYLYDINVLTYGVVFSFGIGFIIYQLYLVKYLDRHISTILLEVRQPLLLSVILFFILYMFFRYVNIDNYIIKQVAVLSISFFYIVIAILFGLFPFLRMGISTLLNQFKIRFYGH